MMLKQKKTTPQDLYKARKEKEDREKHAYLPPGLINHGNTCFMNSVLQGLFATRELYSLVHFSPLPHSFQASSSRPILSKRSPQLTNGHKLGGVSDHERVEGMPLGDAFIGFLQNAWSVQEERRRENLSPKNILAILALKYEQYLDFRQQDAHEFLRLLLDAMRMEELDIIKSRQPPPPKEKKRSKSSPKNSMFGSSVQNSEKLESFVDMLFGGKLASFLVCENCKHVSHTYEDFNDLSLSIKPEDFVKERKRNRLKTLAKKFGLLQWEETPSRSPRSSSVPPSPTRNSFDTTPDDIPISTDPRRRSHELVPSELKNVAAVGDPEGNVATEAVVNDHESDTPPHVGFVQPEKAKKGEKDDDNWVKLGRRITKSVGKKRIGRSRSRDSSSRAGKSKTGDSTEALAPPTLILNGGDFVDITLPISVPASPEPVIIADLPGVTPHLYTPRIPSPSPVQSVINKRTKSPIPPKLSHEESAYLRHILADVTPTSAHHFAIFRPGSAPAFPNGSSAPSTSHSMLAKLGHLLGIEECLRWFTSVEMLDGENMVGCRRCWKIANGMYKDRSIDEDHSESEEGEEAPNTLPSPIRTPGVSPSSVASSDFASAQSSPDLAYNPSPASTSIVSITGEPSLLTFKNNLSAASLPTTIESMRQKKAPPSIVLHKPTLIASVNNPPELNPSIYVDIPIPVISTTAPESPLMSPLATSRTVVPDQMYSLTPTSLNAPNTTRRRPFHKSNRESDSWSEVSSDSFDETESEASFSDASSLASSVVSPNVSQDQLQTPYPPEPANGVPLPKLPPKSLPSKVPRSKQVVMRRCYKRYLISEPPPVLVIHLKRFQQTSKNLMMSFSTGFKKLDDYVTFPEQLDLTPFLVPKKEDFGLDKKRQNAPHKSERVPCVYRLYAVVVHIGNMLGGHYIAYTALPNNGLHPVATTPASETSLAQASKTSVPSKGEPTARQWAYISDTVVKLTTLEEVLKSKAYMCMYERIS